MGSVAWLAELLPSVDDVLPPLVACVVAVAVFGLLLALEVDADGTHR